MADQGLALPLKRFLIVAECPPDWRAFDLYLFRDDEVVFYVFLVLTMTTPLPGTRYFKEAEQLGRIREQSIGQYDFMHPIMDTKFLSAEEVHRLHQAYLKKYYTQPRFLLGGFFNPNPFKRMAYRLILRYVWENATKRPWRQPNLEEMNSSEFGVQSSEK